jgi:DNA polymerase I-like protein with 3'-5' exonuclease and polymerase domains
MNIQNVGKRPGIREAFVPRPGKVFAQCDYPTLELYTLAQCCFTLLGESALGDALNAGLDPHLWFAAKMQGVTYEVASARKKDAEIKRARQLAKAADFGFPGGMGVKKFVSATRKGVMNAARAEGLDPKQAWADLGLDEERAKTLKAEWFEAFPEMPAWFSRADSLGTTEDGRGSVETLFTKRHRGLATYCARCNTPFQGLASDCAKRAGWLLAKAQYVEPSSPLFNTRTVAFVHDEFIVEVPDDARAHDAAYELARLMMIGANEYLPDVPIPWSRMEPLLMRRWSKKAEPRFDMNGRLVVWE